MDKDSRCRKDSDTCCKGIRQDHLLIGSIHVHFSFSDGFCASMVNH